MCGVGVVLLSFWAANILEYVNRETLGLPEFKCGAFVYYGVGVAMVNCLSGFLRPSGLFVVCQFINL